MHQISVDLQSPRHALTYTFTNKSLHYKLYLLTQNTLKIGWAHIQMLNQVFYWVTYKIISKFVSLLYVYSALGPQTSLKDRLINGVPPALFIWLATAKMPLAEAALVAGTQQNLSNLVFLDIYGWVILFKHTVRQRRYLKNQGTSMKNYDDIIFLNLHSNVICNFYFLSQKATTAKQLELF